MAKPGPRYPSAAALEAMDWKHRYFVAVDALLKMECRAEDAERRLHEDDVRMLAEKRGNQP